MPTLVELATQIVTAQATASALSTDDIISSLTRIHTTLGQLETGVASALVTGPADPAPKREPVVTVDKAFKKNEVVCLVCGKPFKSLGSHLSIAHGMTSKQYRQQFGIPKSQPLSSKVHHEIRQKNALCNMAEMAKGRAARAQRMKAAPDPAPVHAAVSDARAAAGKDVAAAGSEGARRVGRPRKKKFTDYIKPS